MKWLRRIIKFCLDYAPQTQILQEFKKSFRSMEVAYADFVMVDVLFLVFGFVSDEEVIIAQRFSDYMAGVPKSTPVQRCRPGTW